MAGALVPDLGPLFTVDIDPSWPYISPAYGGAYGLWRSPMGTSLSVQFMDLVDCITEDVQTQYVDTDIVGRAEQIKTWVGNGNREVSLVFKFHTQGTLPVNVNGSPLGGTDLTALNGQGNQTTNGGATLKSNPPNSQANVEAAVESEVIRPAQFLDALRYPVIDGSGISHGPPPVILTIGELLRMRAIVTGCAVRWCPPFDVNTLLSHHAEVSVTFASCAVLTTGYNFWTATNPSRMGDQANNAGTGIADPFSGIADSGNGAGNGTTGTPT